MTDEELFFKRLREANIKRLPLFKNKRGEPAHSSPDGSDWPIEQWLNATLGEVGEAANVLKKLLRCDFDHRLGMQMFADELADVVIYADITLFRLGDASFKTLLPRERKTIDQLAGEMLKLARYLCYAYDARHNIVKCRYWMLMLLVQAFNIAAEAGIDLQAAVIRKFNEVSDRVGAAVKL